MATFEQLEALKVKGTTAYLEGFKSVINPVGDRISEEVEMSTEITVAPIARNIGPLRKWQGARQGVAVEPTSVLLQAEPFEKTVVIPRIKVETDQTGAYIKQFRDLGYESARWRSYQIVQKLLAGETDLAYDGKAYFADDHVGEDGSAYDNLLGSGNPPWYVFDLTHKPFLWGQLRKPDITHLYDPKDANVFWSNEFVAGVYAHGCAAYGLPQAAVKLKSALDATNFETAQELISSHKDNKGMSLGMGSNLLVVVPTSLRSDAARLFGRKSLGDDGDNIHEGVQWAVCNDLPNS